MQFTAMSFWLFAGAALLTAAALAAMQYLRARPRRTRVVTSLFWRQAAEQTRARTLFERFRHPRTYLLLLAACLLVLLALAAPVFRSAEETYRVVALEAGMEMNAGEGRFENACELVRAEARSLAEDRVAVITADPQPRVLKHFDESLAAMEERLRGMKPADSPVLRDDMLADSRSLLIGRAKGELVLVAAQPSVVGNGKVRVLAAGGVVDNAFLLSAVFEPNSADPTRGSFHCRVGYSGEKAGDVTVSIAGKDGVLSEESFKMEPGATREVSVADIPADGSVLRVSLGGGGSITGDDRLEYPIPDCRRIRIVPVPGFELPEVLVSVIGSLPEVAASAGAGSEGATISIGPVGSGAAIQVHQSEEIGDLLPVSASGHRLVGGIEFEDALCRAPSPGIGQVPDTTVLLLAGGVPLASLDPSGERLIVDSSLLDGQSSVVRRGGYLVFWATMLHHLAGWQDDPVTLSPVEGVRWTDADVEPVVMKAGFGNFNFKADGAAALPGGSLSSRPPVWQWLLLCAFALMLVEAVLHLRGKIS